MNLYACTQFQCTTTVSHPQPLHTPDNIQVPRPSSSSSSATTAAVHSAADGLSSSSGSSQQQHGGSVSWFVQLSDLHINRYVHHDILPDLEAFGRQVLASSRPGALLITGDLVDAKTRPEGSQQHKEEWQVGA